MHQSRCADLKLDQMPCHMGYRVHFSECETCGASRGARLNMCGMWFTDRGGVLYNIYSELVNTIIHVYVYVPV